MRMTSSGSRFTSDMGAGDEEGRGAEDVTTPAALTAPDSTDSEAKVSSAGTSAAAARWGGEGLLRGVTNITDGIPASEPPRSSGLPLSMRRTISPRVTNFPLLPGVLFHQGCRGRADSP